MKSRMNKLMSLCLVAMMGTTFIPQPIQAEEVSEFEEELFEEATVEFEEGTFEEEKQNVEASPENSVTADFEYEGLKYKITDENKKEVEVIGFADGYQPTGYELRIPDRVSKQDGLYEQYTVTSIADSAFKNCQVASIKEIRLPNTLRKIGESAFEGFKSLVDINIPNVVIGKSAFKDCTALDRLYFSKELKVIGESAFAGCTKLENINFGLKQYEDPSLIKLETIENSAFEGCTSLWDIDFSELQHLTTIGESAFAGCTKLGRIELPEGLTTIGDLAFALGKSTSDKMSPHLCFINIPSSVETVGAIFGDKSPFGARNDVTDPFREQEPSLAFLREILPKGIENLLDVISKGNNKPTIYFPNTETAMNIYAGKDSPFVKAGLVNPKLFDSSIEQDYKLIQMCPKTVEEVPIYDYVPCEYEARRFTSTNPDVATAKTDSSNQTGRITAKSIGETTISFVNVFNGQELVSDHNKFKVKVAHRYVWVIDKEATKDEPGSKYQYCVECKDAKEPVKIPPTGGGSGGGSTGGGSTGGSTSGGSGGGSSTGGGSTIDPNAPTQQVENAVYRAYNPYNGEHLYTTNYGEFKVITKNGWDDEGIAFMSESKEKGHAVYRVYNPNSGLHHYTTNVNEKNALVSLGWNDEGVAFYTSKNPKDTPVYRVYNGNDGNHHYTMDANEALALISMGWKNEGIAFLTAPMK